MSIYLTDKFSVTMLDSFNHELLIEHVSIKKMKYLLKKYKSKTIININSRKKASILRVKSRETKISLKKGDEIYVITSDLGRKKSGNKLYPAYKCEKISIIEWRC